MNSHEPSLPESHPRVSSRMRRFLWAGLAVAVIGEGGHQLFDRYGTAIGHHAFHIAMIGGASLLFAGLVALDIRRNGRPRFSWRLHTPAADQRRLPATPSGRPRP